jgi:hypothetical protein
MIRKWRYAPFTLAVVLALSSCSGLHSPGPGGGGTATFSVTLTDALPANTSATNFLVNVTGMTLDPATGSPVSLLSSPVTVDLARLQADDIFLSSTSSVPAGTYSSITFTVSNPVVTFFNQSGAPVSGCANGAVCKIPIAASGSIKVTGSPFPLTLANSQKAGVRLDINFANAITSSPGTLGVDFAAANVLSAAVLPQGNPPAGESDTVADYVGVVSAVNQTAKTVTLTSLTRVPASVTATATGTTVFDNFNISGTCPSLSLACVVVGQVVSAELAVNSDGTFTATEIEFEDTTADDEVEGIVTTVDSATQFHVAVTDKVEAASSSIATLALGDLLGVTLQAIPTFVVDSKGLVIPAGPLGIFQGSSDTSRMKPGETVQVRVKSFTAGTPPVVAVDRVRLRFSRFTATVSGAPAAPFFNITNLPPFFALGIVQVQTFGAQTHFEGVTDVTGLADSQIVSLRAIYINAAPPFYALAVRKH